MGLKYIYSNIKVFISQLICILVKMTLTFEQVGIFSCGFHCCTEENKLCHSNHVFFSSLGKLQKRCFEIKAGFQTNDGE